MFLQFNYEVISVNQTTPFGRFEKQNFDRRSLASLLCSVEFVLGWFYRKGFGALFGCVCIRHVPSAEGKNKGMF